jgi:uncharacterized protein YjbI with pentapeptide repeats
MKGVKPPRSWNFNIDESPEAAVKIMKADLSDGLDKLNISDIEFSDGADIEGVEVIDGRPPEININSCCVKNSYFKNILFIDSEIKRFEINNARFEHCDFSNAVFSEAVVHRAEFINCKMLGTNFTESVFRNAYFKDCKCDYAFFSFANFKQAKFENCNMFQSDFQRAVFTKFAFSKCNLAASQFSGASFRGLDISDCGIEGIIAGPLDLKGAIISAEQAVLLAGTFGLEVKM